MAHYRDSVSNYDLLNLGDFEFQCGAVLNDANLAYKTYGKLDDEGSNAVLIAVPVNGTHQDAASIHIEGENRAPVFSLGSDVSGYGGKCRTHLRFCKVFRA